MSRLNRMAPGLLGLALAVPTVAWAGLPPSVAAQGQPWMNAPARKPADAQPAGAPVAQPGQVVHAAVIDPGSQAMMAEADVPPPPGMSADGRCLGCEAGTLAPVPAGSYVAAYQTGNGPVVAAAGATPYSRAIAAPALAAPANARPYSAPAPPMVARRESAAPGYAVAGGPAPGAELTGEPMPVGVMRTGYRPMGGSVPAPYPGTPGVNAGLGGAPGSAVADMTGRPPMPFAGPMPTPPPHRHSYLKHLFGLDDLGHRSEERYERAREAHAMISYDSATQPTLDLPASAVYGR